MQMNTVVDTRLGLASPSGSKVRAPVKLSRVGYHCAIRMVLRSGNGEMATRLHVAVAGPE